MGEIPGVREELDRLGRALRAQLVELIDDLTPGADLGLLFLDEPNVADWHEPLRYSYSAVFRGERPEGVGAADVASRAAGLLSPADWDIAGPQEEIDGTKRTYVLTARRPDGTRIEVRTGDYNSAVLYSGQTPALAQHESEEFQWPEPVRTPETLTPGYVLCYECDGLGACRGCGGRGWVPSERHGRSNCRQCGRQRVCPICRGGGQLDVSQLSPYQLTYYPKLSQ
ncbi:hypothetical protein OG322_33435 [Streptomyces sp. NBC_01260]|uniref:hypothetical protein n=1 Tax=unclassified Streptomyces TaxID=2593676 RepID=UPI00225AE633|nr:MULTISPECIES: hypothetical protein [unclassified Streptomyces]MCX4774161.1 hypothetical protein [Streptomyces sp. NBC_01285]